MIDCVISQELWSQVEMWIRSLGMCDYILTDRREIIGDLENNPSINIIILNSKKILYRAKLDKKAAFSTGSSQC